MIVRIHGSSSQPLASRMMIAEGGDFAGFVSGGCVETDVVESAKRVLADGKPRRLQYKQVDDSLFEIGLNCEGQIDVIVEPVTRQLLDWLSSSEPSCLTTEWKDLEDGIVWVRHRSISEHQDVEEELAAVETVLETGRAQSIELPGDLQALVEPVGVRNTLVIVSVSSVAHPLSRIAHELGYEVVISDPREDYLDPENFPHARLIHGWPRDLPKHLVFGPRVAVVSLNHEPRFEDDLFATLQSQPPVAYLGALGKRQRHLDRLGRQSESGVDYARLPEIHTPIGLDLGGKSPEEVALSILSEIQAERFGRSGGPLFARFNR